jgi:hypothetical protein
VVGADDADEETENTGGGVGDLFFRPCTKRLRGGGWLPLVNEEAAEEYGVRVEEVVELEVSEQSFCEKDDLVGLVE